MIRREVCVCFGQLARTGDDWLKLLRVGRIPYDEMDSSHPILLPQETGTLCAGSSTGNRHSLCRFFHRKQALFVQVPLCTKKLRRWRDNIFGGILGILLLFIFLFFYLVPIFLNLGSTFQDGVGEIHKYVMIVLPPPLLPHPLHNLIGLQQQLQLSFLMLSQHHLMMQKLLQEQIMQQQQQQLMQQPLVQ